MGRMLSGDWSGCVAAVSGGDTASFGNEAQHRHRHVDRDLCGPVVVVSAGPQTASGDSILGKRDERQLDFPAVLPQLRMLPREFALDCNLSMGSA